MVRQINLTERNGQKLDELARQTGNSPDELANEAVERFAVDTKKDEQLKFNEWREALLRLKGMWADRDDLPDFAELRQSWDRGYINRK